MLFMVFILFLKNIEHMLYHYTHTHTREETLPLQGGQDTPDCAILSKAKQGGRTHGDIQARIAG